MFTSHLANIITINLPLIVFIIPVLVFAQSQQEAKSISLYPSFSKLSFSQDLNFYKWNYNLKILKELDNCLEFNFSEDFGSTLQRISTMDLWKDEHNLTLSIGYPVTNNLLIESEFISYMLSDPLAGFDNDVTLHASTLKVVYQPNSKISIAPSVHSKWQTQMEQSDQGFSYGLEANFNKIDFHDYINDVSFLSEQNFTPQRKNEDIKFRYKVVRNFYESTADTLIIFFDRLQRDSFDADVDGIFIRNLTQSNRGLENRLSYKIASNVFLLLKNSVLATSFKVNNLRDNETELRKDDAGFETNHTLILNLKKSSWFSNLSWSFRSRSRDDCRPQGKIVDPFRTRHPSLGFDTDDLNVSLGLHAGLKVTSSDSLGLFSSVSKFQYDTSDTTNSNSHDQLRWHFNFSHAHIFNPTLRIVWRGSAFLNHFVYVSGKFSSGNNWERIFQLTPEIVYQPSSNFYFRQSFTVRAKYQTYDFDDPETSNRNIVNRQFIMSNTSNFALTPKTWVELGFHLELAEQGKLFYNLWRQQLALSWRNQQIQVYFRHKIGSNLVFSPGGSFFQQLRWDHSVKENGSFKKSVKDQHTNFGPLLEISYRPSRTLEFVFLGNTQVVFSSRRNTEYINHFDVHLNWFF
ncbi:MAG: hypothetical protein ACE5JB_01400 [bacterium]